MLKEEDKRRRSVGNNNSQTPSASATSSLRSSVSTNAGDNGIGATQVASETSLPRNSEATNGGNTGIVDTSTATMQLVDESKKPAAQASSSDNKKKTYVFNGKKFDNIEQSTLSYHIINKKYYFKPEYKSIIENHRSKLNNNNLIGKLGDNDREKICTEIKIEGTDAEEFIKKLTENYLILEGDDLEKLEKNVYNHFYKKNEDPNIIKFYSFDVKHAKSNYKNFKNGSKGSERWLKEIVYKRTSINPKYFEDNNEDNNDDNTGFFLKAEYQNENEPKVL